VLSLRVHSYDPLGALGDALGYSSARSNFLSTLALLAGVPVGAVQLTSVSTFRILIEAAAWDAPLSGPPAAEWPPRTSACPVTSLEAGSCASTWRSISISEASVTLTGLPTYSCVADPVALFIGSSLNTSASMAALGSAVLTGALPGGGLATGYSVPANLRVSLGSASLQAPALAACSGSSQGLTLAQLTGYDVRALPATFTNNSAGTGIVVIDSSVCGAVAGTALACGAQSFTVGGKAFSFVSTLAALNMVAV